MMIDTRLVLALAPLLSVVACASSPEGAAQQLTGCYYFEQDETARELNLPWGIELTSDSLTSAPLLQGRENVREALTLLGPDEKRPYPFGYWQVTGENTIRIGSAGMGGFTAELTVEGHQLSGILGGAGDAAPSPQPRSAHVRLTRAQCPG